MTNTERWGPTAVSFGAIFHSISMGVLTIVTVLPWNILVIFLWFMGFIWHAQRLKGVKPWTLLMPPLLVPSGIFGLILFAGVIAPVKTVDNWLDRRMTLPAKTMSLSQWSGESDKKPLDWRPSWIRFEALTRDDTTTLEFPSREISVRQFVQVIEAQTTWRHKFAHCGNGTTILWGGDCSFGLVFRDKKAIHSRRPDKLSRSGQDSD